MYLTKVEYFSLLFKAEKTIKNSCIILKNTMELFFNIVSVCDCMVLRFLITNN